MINATSRSGFSGRIERNKQLSAKAYTNFVQIIDQLGYATRRDHNGVSFNLRSMFEIPGLGPLAGELLGHKLTAARWDGEGTIADEAIAHNFHRVLGLTPREFKDWITTDSQPEAAGNQLLPKDEEFFQTEEEDIPLQHSSSSQATRNGPPTRLRDPRLRDHKPTSGITTSKIAYTLTSRKSLAKTTSEQK